MIREARAQSRNPVAQKKIHREVTLPAPISGWASNSSIALDNPGHAEVLENFIPTQTGIRPRGGSALFATVSTKAITRFLTYLGTTSKKLFVASNNAIFDITSPVSSTTIPAEVVSGLTSTEISYVNFSNAGGDFLLAFNGADLHRVYNGATWVTNTPAITGVSSAIISQAAIHNSRVWMVEKNSKRAWYLGVNDIGGVALDFSLEGEFRKGGKLLFIASWSYDSGSGSSDRIVFVSDEGEAAVFGGLFPGDATWQRFGRYELPRPLGKYAFDKVGADLIIETVSGIVPMSEIISKDPAALSVTAITKAIETDWRYEVGVNGSRPWSFQKWEEQKIGFVAIPNATEIKTGTSVWGTFVWGVDPWGAGWTVENPVGDLKCFVVNLLTGKWAKITGWDMRCMAVFDGKFYFGASNGQILEGDVGGNDDGASYECRLAYWPSKFGSIGYKTFLQCNGTFVHSTPINPKLSISVNNKLDWPVAPPAAAPSSSTVLWNNGVLWNSGALWSGKKTKAVTTKRWTSLGRSGRVGALKLQMTFNTMIKPDIEYTESVMTYEDGGIVT
jgi:hypothetical protein